MVFEENLNEMQNKETVTQLIIEMLKLKNFYEELYKNNKESKEHVIHRKKSSIITESPELDPKCSFAFKVAASMTTAQALHDIISSNKFSILLNEMTLLLHLYWDRLKVEDLLPDVRWYLFILANVASSKLGAELLLNEEQHNPLISTVILLHLQLIEIPDLYFITELLLVMLYNLSLNQSGREYLQNCETIYNSIWKITNSPGEDNIKMLTLRLLLSLTEDYDESNSLLKQFCNALMEQLKQLANNDMYKATIKLILKNISG